MRGAAMLLIVSWAGGAVCTAAHAKTMQVTGYVYLGVIKVNEQWTPTVNEERDRQRRGNYVSYWQVDKDLEAAYIEKPVHTFGAMAYATPRYQITGDRLPEIVRLFNETPPLPRERPWGGRLDTPESFQRGGRLVVTVVGDVSLQRPGSALGEGNSQDPDVSNRFGDLYAIRVDRIIKTEPGTEFMKSKGLETIRRIEGALAAGRKGSYTSWWWIGVVYEMIGDVEHAIPAWQKAWRLEPQYRRWIATKFDTYKVTPETP